MNERLISQLAHVELLTPKPQESLEFFTEVLGLEESGRASQSVYLRCWGDYFHHSVVLTEAPAPRWSRRLESRRSRAAGARRRAPQDSGLGEGWVQDTPGHGPAYRYVSPGGHRHEIFWEVERYAAPPESARASRPARSDRPRAVSVPGSSTTSRWRPRIRTATPCGTATRSRTGSWNTPGSTSTRT